jgi:CO dehydrogenase maturation factor
MSLLCAVKCSALDSTTAITFSPSREKPTSMSWLDKNPNWGGIPNAAPIHQEWVNGTGSEGDDMKLAITGKGGVGKTTLTALLAQVYADKGRQVLAVDADPSPCRGVRLLEMGSVTQGGSGCICPESAMLKALFTHLLFSQEDVLLLDMYAGVEHLGRATVDFVDAMLIVVEPTRRSLGTAAQIKKLANDIGLKRLYLVGNKVRSDDEAAFLKTGMPGLPMLGCLPADLRVQEADRLGIAVFDHVPELKRSTEEMAAKLSL